MAPSLMRNPALLAIVALVFLGTVQFVMFTSFGRPEDTSRAVLITGGTGYIGSHTAVELIQHGFTVYIIDNLQNSNVKVLDRIEVITGVRPRFTAVDLCDGDAVEKFFQASPRFQAVIHFAAMKLVGESMQKTLHYYRNNMFSTLNLLRSMEAHNCRKLVFSSSCTVYGEPKTMPVSEDTPLGPVSPYGQTKYMSEQILRDLVKNSKAPWRVVLLRYFNPIGAHPSGLIGEDPRGVPQQIAPYIAQLAVGKLSGKVRVFGDKWPTKDGTGVRDYLHVVDLALGHLVALNNIVLVPSKQNESFIDAFNLAIGTGVTVKEMIGYFSEAVGRPIPYEIVAPRPGDVAMVYANPTKAETVLGWHAARSVKQAAADHYRWQRLNPNGYESPLPALSNA